MAPKKNAQEAKVERFTWFLMVLVFAVLYLFPPAENDIPNWVVPLSGSVILLGSGIYQYARRWRVSPIVWIAGTILVLITVVNIYVFPQNNFFGLVLIIFAAVIALGTFTGNT